MNESVQITYIRGLCDYSFNLLELTPSRRGKRLCRDVKRSWMVTQQQFRVK